MPFSIRKDGGQMQLALHQPTPLLLRNFKRSFMTLLPGTIGPSLSPSSIPYCLLIFLESNLLIETFFIGSMGISVSLT